MAQAPARSRKDLVVWDGVSVTYPGASAPTLRDVSFTIARRELVTVVGPSGAGKTTLLRALTGKVRPTGTVARVAGHDLLTLPPRHLPRLRRQIGVAFQDAQLLPGRTAAANITYALELAGTGHRAAVRRAHEVLDIVGIGDLAHVTPEHLSGGQAQRVALARALAPEPALLLADEPTGALDLASTRAIIDTLTRLPAMGTAVILVTHDLDARDQVAARTLTVADGTVTEAPAHTRRGRRVAP